MKLAAINNSIKEALKRINVKISKNTPLRCLDTTDPLQNDNSDYILYVVAVGIKYKLFYATVTELSRYTS
jgi:hypothetical protein